MPIPDDLRDSLREVSKLIRQAEDDPEIILDFDDAIQVGAVCGGRYGKGTRPYVLIYDPQGDPQPGRWDLTLHRAEIEDIGDGRMTELLLYCCTSPDCRCKFREADAHCSHCDYADDPDFATFPFPEAEARLTRWGVSGVSEGTTKEGVVALLGLPDASGGGIKTPVLGYIWPWIKYRRADCQLRFEFNRAGTRIRNVTVMDRDWEPGG